MTLHVSAGGVNARLREYAKTRHEGGPKHSLPILPGDGAPTILDLIINQARLVFDSVVVHANADNVATFKPMCDKFSRVCVIVDQHLTGPLGPMIRTVQSTNERSFGCAGDFVHFNFAWGKFLDFHDRHDLPISILVSRSIEAPLGARFMLREERLSSWERVTRTTNTDRINIGAYIVDPHPEVLRLLHELSWHKEDPFFDAMIKAGLIAAYDPGGIGFNINTEAVHQAVMARGSGLLQL